MSLTALLASNRPLECCVCGVKFKDSDKVVALLWTRYYEVPGYEDGDYVVDMDYTDDHVAHESCISKSIERR